VAEKQTPFGTFRFLIEVEGSKAIAGAFAQFSGIKLQVESIRGRTGEENRGVRQAIPVFTTFAPVTLTKGVVRDNEFIDWLFAAVAGPYSGPSGKDLRRTLNVIVLDEKGNRGVTWSLKNAVPIGYELSPMDGGQSGVLSESLTFGFNGMERIREPDPSEPGHSLQDLFDKFPNFYNLA